MHIRAHRHILQHYVHYIIPLTCINLSYSVVFDSFSFSDRERVVARRTLALPDEEGAGLVPDLEQFLFGIRSLDTAKEPAVLGVCVCV